MNNQIVQSIKDIDPILYVPFYKKWWFLSVTFVCLIIILLFITYGIYKLYITKKVVKKTPAQKAFEMLAVLKNKKNSSDKIFFSELTFIVKWYLQHHYKILALSKTDAELFVLFDTPLFYKLSQNEKQILKDLFEKIESIKFSGYSDIQKNREYFMKKIASILDTD